MSFVKIFFILAVIAVVVVAVVYYSLSPTIRNVSNEPVLKPFIKKYVTLKTKASIIQAEKGQYTFDSNILSKDGTYSQTPLLKLVPGDEIIIHQFKTHRSNIGSGFTHLYALGEVTKDRQVLTFEYDLGILDGDSNSTTVLTTTVWQDDNDPRIEWRRGNR